MANVPSKPLRVGICGLGDWAWRHVKLLAETGGFEVVAIASRSDAAWERARRDLPGARLFREHTALLAEARPNLVIITTPHHLHAPMSIDALRAGAHVIVEKPMATSVADGKAMIAAARQAGRMLAVYHNRRFDPWLVAAHDIIRSDELGRVIELNAHWPDNAPAGSWRTRKLESGGVFFDVGAHLADYLIALAGSQPVRVSGFVHRRPERDPALNEDHAVATFEFASGARGRLTASSLDLAPARRFHLVGEKGTLVDTWNWGGGSGEVHTRNAAGHPQVRTYPYGHEDDSGGGRPIYRNLAAHLFEGAPLAVTPEAALTNIALLLAAEASASQGGAWIDLARFIADA